MRSLWSILRVGVACLILATCLAAAMQKDDKNTKDKDQDARRPKITLRALPVISVAPSRVVLTVELLGGSNDYEDYYCPTVEWEWGDGTKSESSNDCEPYELGKTEIRRRFSVTHVFSAGEHRITFRMKRRDKALGTATTTIQVRPGLSDIGR